MNRLLLKAALAATLSAANFQLGAQTPAGQAAPAPSTADPYANNLDAGKMQFPLAAPAGKDSGAITTAPAGAANQGMIVPGKWKYGPAYDQTAPSKIWNPVKLKMMRGEKVT